MKTCDSDTCVRDAAYRVAVYGTVALVCRYHLVSTINRLIRNPGSAAANVTEVRR